MLVVVLVVMLVVVPLVMLVVVFVSAFVCHGCLLGGRGPSGALMLGLSM